MTFWKLIRRNLSFHARAHLGVVLGAAIGSAALIGALVVGDSVRVSLTHAALRRLGKIHFALSTQDRLFQASLGLRLSGRWPPAPTNDVASKAASFDPHPTCPQSAVLALPGIVARQDGTARDNRVNVFGVDMNTWLLLLADASGDTAKEIQLLNTFSGRYEFLLRHWRTGETALINSTLARQLGAREGDEIVLRVRKPTVLGLDAALSPRNEDTVAIRLKVGAIVQPEALGDFELAAQPAPPANLFLARESLADKVGVRDRANVMVTASLLASESATRGVEPKHERPLPDELALPLLNAESVSYTHLTLPTKRIV